MHTENITKIARNVAKSPNFQPLLHEINATEKEGNIRFWIIRGNTASSVHA